MKLWHLERMERAGHDEYIEHVIRAEDEASARAMAVATAADEGKWTWMSSEKSTCKELTADGDAEIVVASFNAG